MLSRAPEQSLEPANVPIVVQVEIYGTIEGEDKARTGDVRASASGGRRQRRLVTGDRDEPASHPGTGETPVTARRNANFDCSVPSKRDSLRVDLDGFHGRPRPDEMGERTFRDSKSNDRGARRAVEEIDRRRRVRDVG